MKKYASEKLSEAFAVLDGIGAKEYLSFYFKRIWDEVSGESAQIAIHYLFVELQHEVSRSRLNEKVAERTRGKITALVQNFQSALNSNMSNEFWSKFSLSNAMETLDDITDLLDTAGLPRSGALNRELLLDSTTSLIAEIEGLKLPPNVTRLATLELSSVSRLLTAGTLRTDGEIAMLVKAVVADLLVGLEEFCDKEPSLRDKIIQWGRVGTHSSALVLGLLIDTNAAYELVSGPEKPALLEAPAMQLSVDEAEDK